MTESITVAVISFVGVVVGAVVSVVGTIVIRYLDRKAAEKRDKPRKTC